MADTARDRLRAQLAVVAHWLGAPATADETDASAWERADTVGKATTPMEGATRATRRGDAGEHETAESAPAQEAARESGVAARPEFTGAPQTNAALLVARQRRAERKRISARWTPSMATVSEVPVARLPAAPPIAPSPWLSAQSAAAVEPALGRASLRAPLSAPPAPARAPHGVSQRLERWPATQQLVRDAAPSFAQRAPRPRHLEDSAAVWQPSTTPRPEQVPPLPIAVAVSPPEIDLDFVEEALADRLELAALEMGVELS